MSTSKFQRHLGRVLEELGLPYATEQALGPYVLDYALPHRVGIEVDGYKHFYVLSRQVTAKTELKYRVLHALGWRMVSIKHFDWLPKTREERLRFLAGVGEKTPDCDMTERHVANHARRITIDRDVGKAPVHPLRAE